jgi:hypothetical protein
MINKIKVNNLIQQILNAAIVDVMGEATGVKVEWDVEEATGDPKNQVLLLTWEDEGKQSFSVIFTERGLSDARVSGNNIFLKDHEGEKTHLVLWEQIGMDCEGNLKLGDEYPPVSC